MDPLLTVVPTFTTYSIEQSSPLNSVKNTLTIVLTSDVDLATGSTVTISGLVGPTTVTNPTQTITSTTSLYGTSADWNSAGVRPQLLQSDHLGCWCVWIGWSRSGVERGDQVHGPCADVRCVEQTLILTVGATATAATTGVTVTIELDNSATAQVAVAPTVRPVPGGQSAVQSNGLFWTVA
jgi:hypothetical protein